jgi:hypothetical protein
MNSKGQSPVLLMVDGSGSRPARPPEVVEDERTAFSKTTGM